MGVDTSEYVSDYIEEVARGCYYLDPSEWVYENVSADGLDDYDLIEAAEEGLEEMVEYSLSRRNGVREALTELANEGVQRAAREEIESTISGWGLDTCSDIRTTEPEGEEIGPHPDDDELTCYRSPWGVWKHIEDHDLWLCFTDDYEQPADETLREIVNG